MKTEDDFSKAFQQSNDAQLPGAPAPAPAPAPTEAPAPTPAPAPAATTAPAPAPTEAAIQPTEVPPAPAAPAPSPSPSPAPAPAPTDDGGDPGDDPAKLKARLSTVQGLLRKANQDAQSWKQRAERATTPAPTPAATPAPTPAPQVDPEEEAVLEELKTTAPTLHKAMVTMLNRREKAIQDAVDKRVKDVLGSEVAPLKAHVETSAVQAHYDSIEAAHPGWQQTVLSPELQAWVASKPSFLQREFARIANEGTAPEVIEVLNTFTAETKPQQQQTTNAGADPAATPAPAPNPDPKRVAQERALGTLPTRTAPTSARGGPPKDSFDAGFEQAAAVSASA